MRGGVAGAGAAVAGGVAGGGERSTSELLKRSLIKCPGASCQTLAGGDPPERATPPRFHGIRPPAIGARAACEAATRRQQRHQKARTRAFGRIYRARRDSGALRARAPSVEGSRGARTER